MTSACRTTTGYVGSYFELHSQVRAPWDNVRAICSLNRAMIGNGGNQQISLSVNYVIRIYLRLLVFFQPPPKSDRVLVLDALKR
jgi:hypothetical protein